MDNLEKKRLANEKRLKAIKEWQKNRNQVIKISSDNLDIKAPNKKKVYNSDEEAETANKSNQLKLFDSDEENEDSENYEDCFKIRPQFEGRNGQRMLEMNSELSDRFKLDERFREEEPIHSEDLEDSEKDKNIRILESILGHEVVKKQPNAKRERGMERFNPDDENNVSCIKNVESLPKKPKAKKKKPEPEVPPEEVPISTERYVEVSSNLKEIINTAGSFSFSEKFNNMVDPKEIKKNDVFSEKVHFESSIAKTDATKASTSLNKDANVPVMNMSQFSSTFKDPFFISSSDERLKEGVQFFIRPKPLDQIRVEWAKKRERVLAIFKKRRKSAIRGFTKRPKKQNQRNKVSSKK